MRNHQQHKENNINSNNNHTTTNNNNNHNNSSNPTTNRYQFCLHPVMSATVTAQHSSGATPTIMNNHTSTATATSTTNATSLNINTNTNTTSVNNSHSNNSNSSLSPSAIKANTNDTLNSQQKQFIATTTATKLSTTLFNATKTNLSTSSSSSASSSFSSTSSTTTTTTTITSSSSPAPAPSSPSSPSLTSSSSVATTGPTIATSSSFVAVSLTPPISKASASSALPAMPQTVAQQLTKLNSDDDHHHHHHDHQHQHYNQEQIINNNNNNNTSCLNDSRKSVNSTTKSFKEIHHNNINNKNNNSGCNNTNSNSNNNINNNCNNNHFTEIMQRNNNKRLSPTQESSNMSFSSASVAGSIQDDIGDQCGLTKAGLEEYTMRSNSLYDNPVLYHHQKQSSYAQSEGYHSYVSSSDSTSATPMLDRLRQESELLSRQTSSHHWSQNDLSSLASTSVAASPTLLLSSGRDLSELSTQHQQQQHQHQQQRQQHNNSSESTSSTETLKWLGSMSDVSEVSHATGFSAISESVSTSQLIVHSSRVLTPKRHQSESVLYTTEEQALQQQHLHGSNTQSPQLSPNSLQTLAVSPPSLGSTLTPSHRHSPSYPPIHQTSHTLYRHQHHEQNTSPLELDLTKSMIEITSSQTTLSNCDAPAQKSNISVTISNSEAVVTISPQPPPVTAPKPNTCNDTQQTTSHNLLESQSQTNISARSQGLPMQSSSLSMVGGHKSVSASMDSLSDIKHPYRNNHRLFPVSTYTEPVHSNTSHFVHHPKPQYSIGLQKPQKNQQAAATSTGSSSTSSSSASSPSVSGSHSNLHQPKLCSPNYPQPSWQSVAALINDFEKTSDQQQQLQKYTFLDPNKTHRVPNPALKAFQKNAVQSYFERQQQQQQQQQQHQYNQTHTHSMDNLSPKLYQQPQQAITRPSSLQNTSQEEVQTVLLRNSLPNNYNTTTGQRPLSEDKNSYSTRNLNSLANKPPSPAPPPPPPRSRSMMPTLLRRSSSASDYAELRDQFISSPKEKLQSQSIKNISNSEKFSFNDCGMPPPPPPPRGRSSMPPRRTSSAAEYAAIRDKVLLQQAAALTHQQLHPHQHQHQHQHQQLGIMSSSYHHPTHYAHHPHQQHSPQSYLNGFPMIPPLQDGWVPERPPKNPNLRVPSPDLPPPPPGLETETTIPDEPLPPPPPEILQRQPLMDATMDATVKPPSPNRRNSFAGASLRKTNFFSRSPSNDSVNVAAKGPPPLIPRKPASIELLQVSRPSATTLNQLNSAKVQPELCRATIISSSTRKRPHNVAATTLASPSIPAIQENVSAMSKHNVRHSPTGPTSLLHTQTSKSSPPPPPLMPRMSNVQQQQTLLTQQQLSNSLSNISNANANLSNQKSRCNSKASYLPRQSLEKQNNSDPDHGSYKMTLHSNEDLVTTTKSSYDILAQAPKLPNNLPDVLPLGAKLQTSSNTSLNSVPSLRYGSKNMSSNSPTSQPSYTTYAQQQQAQQQLQQQRYSTPVLNTFNLSSNFSRSQSFDTNVHNAMTQSPTKYMTQSSLDLKKPINNLETTIEEPNLIDATIMKDNNSSISSLSSLSESCNSHEDRLNTSSNASISSSETINNNSIFRAELVNTTFANNASNNNNSKKSVTRQESLRENIEKITQLQSQLMSAHITDNAFMGSYASQMLPQSSTNKTSQAHVIDIPKSQEPMKIEEENLCSDTEAESLLPPPAPLTPPPAAKHLDINSPTANTNTSSVKSPKILEKEHNADSSILSQLDSSTDSLKLVQRSEIILRVNASTVETASQTDDIADSELKSLSEIINSKETETPTRITLQPRRRLPIEDDCEKLSKELANMLSPNDVLINILCPPGSKTVADYVTNLYNPNVPIRPSKRHVGTSTLTRSSNKNKGDQESNEKITVELKLSELEQTPENCDILKNKVDDLIKHLNNKVRILTKEQAGLDEESAINDELGNCLLNKLSDKIRPIEASKCRTYISDIGHITGLLLSLSERLARAENNLTTVIENNTEKKSLENKRDRLLEQLTEAKRLKEDIDRRGSSVVSLLEKNLSSNEFADFEYFINMKAKLITDARDITDKIKMGEEIITALSDTLIQSDC